MTSFQITLSPNRRAAARFIGQVRRSLQKAYVEEQKKNGLSQSEIARLLKVHRSVINRELKGLKDITLGRVGELCWAMGRKPFFSAEDTHVSLSANFTNVPLPVSHAIPTSTTTTAAMNSTTTSHMAMNISNIFPLASAA